MEKTIKLHQLILTFKSAAKEVTEQLIQNGATKFALVGGDYSKKAQDDVLDGLSEALRGISLNLTMLYILLEKKVIKKVYMHLNSYKAIIRMLF